MANPHRPDERALLIELDSPRFELGIALGQWNIVSLHWPSMVFSVTARDTRKFTFRCECGGYPSNRPSISIWDPNQDIPLAATDRPVMLDPYQLVFRIDWEAGQHLYHPMERHAFATHGGWSNELKYKLWNPNRGLTQLCQELHGILNSSAYQPDQAYAA